MDQLYNQKQLLPIRRALRRQQTDAERTLWSRLRNRQLMGLKFFRQYTVKNFILDFYCPTARLAIELDGGQHGEKPNRTHDEQRSRELERHGITVTRFWNTDVMKNIEGVLEVIARATTAPDEPPMSPFSKGGN